MTLLDKYLKGNCKEVYNEIYSLDQEAFEPSNFTQIDLVLKETFRRVSYNLDIIYKELKKINYLFTSNPKYDWQIPLVTPNINVEKLINEMTSRVKEGYIPLSLKYFFRIVGSCNFCWDYNTNPDIPWEGADPIEIPPVNDLLEMIDEDFDSEDIIICGDYLHKDNISGDTYSIQLTVSQSIDSLFLDWDLPFIDYLRLTFKNCGFTRADQCNYDSLNSFINLVKPQLLDI